MPTYYKTCILCPNVLNYPCGTMMLQNLLKKRISDPAKSVKKRMSVMSIIFIEKNNKIPMTKQVI